MLKFIHLFKIILFNILLYFILDNMPYNKSKLINQIFNTNVKINDGILELNNYLERPSILNKDFMNEQIPLIESVNIINALQVCENSINIITEFQNILNEEDKRRKYKGLLVEVEKKGSARKLIKERREERKKEFNPYALRRLDSGGLPKN